jgi:hypothetical protein
MIFAKRDYVVCYNLPVLLTLAIFPYDFECSSAPINCLRHTALRTRHRTGCVGMERWSFRGAYPDVAVCKWQSIEKQKEKHGSSSSDGRRRGSADVKVDAVGVAA